MDITGLSEKELKYLAVILNTDSYTTRVATSSLEYHFPEFSGIDVKELHKYKYKLYKVVHKLLELD